MSRPRGLFHGARGAILAALLGIGLLGCAFDAWVLESALTHGSGTDGLGLFFPVIGAAILLPLQLLGLVALLTARRRHQRLAPLEGVFELPPRSPALPAAAALFAGVPALAMASAIALERLFPSDVYQPLYWQIAEPGTLLWGPCWAIGVLLCGAAFGLQDRRLVLLLIPVYPALGAYYMFN